MKTHIFRAVLSVILIWIGVYPETGFWTAITLTLLFIGVELDLYFAEELRKLNQEEMKLHWRMMELLRKDKHNARK